MVLPRDASPSLLGIFFSYMRLSRLTPRDGDGPLPRRSLLAFVVFAWRSTQPSGFSRCLGQNERAVSAGSVLLDSKPSWIDGFQQCEQSPRKNIRRRNNEKNGKQEGIGPDGSSRRVFFFVSHPCAPHPTCTHGSNSRFAVHISRGGGENDTWAARQPCGPHHTHHRRRQQRQIQSSAVSMLFWKPPPTSEHTRLAKKPALDKCKPDEEWRKELRPNTFQVRRLSSGSLRICARAKHLPRFAPLPHLLATPIGCQALVLLLLLFLSSVTVLLIFFLGYFIALVD